jgi:hypothetical protein
MSFALIGQVLLFPVLIMGGTPVVIDMEHTMCDYSRLFH